MGKQSRIEAAKRQREALRLRAQGYSFDMIAAELNYASRSGAWKSVQAALKAIKTEGVTELRTLEGQRLDVLLEGVWKQAKKGNVKAVGAALAIMQRRAKLQGLDRPSKIEVQNFLHGAEWSRIKDAVQKALLDFPEAAQAVAEALQELDNE